MIHSFTFQDEFILLDTESGSIHTVDESAFLVAQAIENGEDPHRCGAPEGDVDEILAEPECFADGLIRDDEGVLIRQIRMKDEKHSS